MSSSLTMEESAWLAVNINTLMFGWSQRVGEGTSDVISDARNELR